MNTKQQGNIGIGAAISYFLQNLYTVSLPINDSQKYDLIVEKGGVLQTVQVKTTRVKAPSGNYKINVKSSGGTSGKIYNRLCENDVVDLLYILTDSGEQFLISKEIFSTYRSSITLKEEYSAGRAIIGEISWL